MVDQESFIKCGGNLRYKDGITGVGVGLIFVGKIAVHGMAEFMGQRAHIIIFAVIVKQHIRMNIIDRAVGVSAGAFALAGKDVNPAFAKGFSSDSNIIATQWRQRSEDILLGLFNGVFQ